MSPVEISVSREAALGLNSQCADHIIRFDPFDRDQWQPQCTDDVVDRLDLLAQIVGHRGPVGLVVGVDLVTKGFTLGIEHHHYRALRVLLDQLAQHAGDYPDGAGREAVLGAQISLLGGEERAVQIGGTVNQNQRGWGCRS